MQGMVDLGGGILGLADAFVTSRKRAPPGGRKLRGRERRKARPIAMRDSPSSLSDLTFGPLISLVFLKLWIITIVNDISMLRGTKTVSPTGC
jgi:hypothetical protein